MKNLDIYESVRAVPEEAKKPFNNGRFSGTDIKPMWRIKKLTEQFGVCGFGWKTIIKRMWLEQGAKDEVAAFCEIELYVKIDDKWSEAIPGIGGNMFTDLTKSSGLKNSDECFKMAYTDAISVACKALGVGADVYWEQDKSKYGKDDVDGSKTGKPQTLREKRIAELTPFMQTKAGKDRVAELIKEAGSGKPVEELSESMFKKIIQKLTEESGNE